LSVEVLFFLVFLNEQKAWADEVEDWENCRKDDISCPTMYVSKNALLRSLVIASKISLTSHKSSSYKF